jgi:DNA-binding HxlR family transcriptional regulator
MFNQSYIKNRNIKLNMVKKYCLLGWDSLEEEKIRKILTDEKLSAIKAVLEKDHAIDCLFLLYLGKGRWKNAKAFMRELNLTLSDGTFRSRMIEMEDLRLAKSVAIDPLKNYYVKTELGEKLAELLLNLFDELE